MGSSERVRVVPRSALPDLSGWRGVRHLDLAAVTALVDRHGHDAPRDRVESDRALKQIIPYVVVRDGPRYFLMRRTRAGADARLHERWSIGVGGHLNPGDRGIDDGLRREWHEEIDAPFVPEFRYVGILNDDTTDVGAVHLGIVFEAAVDGRPIQVRETDKLSGGFATADEIRAGHDRLESWSALVFDHLEGHEEVRAGAAGGVVP